MAQGFQAPLAWLIAMVDKLLTEEDFNDMQRTFLLNIAQESQSLQTLVLTMADVSRDSAKQMMSFDGRSHLNSIIGYTEELLDEVEGELSDSQRDLLFEVRASGRQLLSQLEDLLK